MDNIIYSIENFARSWLEFILSSSLQLGIFLVLIAALTFVFRKQPAKFLYILWLIGLLKVIIPPTIKIPDFFASANIPIAPNIFIFPIQEISFVTIALKMPELSYKGYLLLFWISGIFLISVVWIYNNIRFYRKIKRNSFSIDNPEVSNLVKYKNSRIRFYSGPDITIPFTRGIFNPKIFLPNQALSWSKNELRAVVLHEYAHIKRKDIVVIAFQNLVQILFFFHPLVWLANIQIARYREKACDDFAINAMKGNSVDYSKFLLKSIDNAINWQPLPSMSNYFNQSKKSLLNRFEYILNRKEDVMNKFSRFQKFVFLVLVMFGVAISCHKDQLKSTTSTSTGQETTKESDSAKIEKGKATPIPAIPSIPAPPPPPSDSDDIHFVPYDDPPKPIGGFAAIQENLHYPELARKAGIEGTVIVYAKIDTKGVVSKTKIIKPIGKTTVCNEAAVQALKSVKWIPAKQKDKPVAVWVSVPVKFKLSQEAKEGLLVPGSDIHPEAMVQNNLQQENLIKLPYDTPPAPVGGIEAIYKNLIIPKAVKELKLEGKVEIYTKIDKSGEIVDIRTKKSLCTDCEKAAISALRSVKWIPAKLNDKPVTVWVNLPLYLALDGDWKRLKQGDSRERMRKIVAEQIKQVPPPPPPIQNFDDIPFIPYDDFPEPVGGFEAIYKNLVYPKKAKEAWIEGTVAVYTQIKADGTIGATKIWKSLGHGCDEAAIKAIKSIKWIPAKQKGRPVTVWVSVLVRFDLSQDTKFGLRVPGNDTQSSTSMSGWVNFKTKKILPYDTPPEPVGGYKELYKKIRYPEAASLVYGEATVTIQTKVNDQGKVVDYQVKEPYGSGEFVKSAVDAIKSIKWHPAFLQGKAVEAWFTVPIHYKLSDGKRKVIPEGHEETENTKIDEVPLKYYPPSEQFKDQITFVPYDKAPQPVGGFKAIQKKLVYPAIARQAGVEGKVIIYAKVSKDGEIIDTRVVKPLGNSGCNEAAIDAIKSVEWKPALQKKKPVTVWVSVPVKFKLR